MASIESGVLALQNELEKAKENLKDVDENIKKLTGRDPYEQRQGGNRRLSQSGDLRGRGRPFTPGGRRFSDNEGQAARRLVGGAFSRLGISPRAAGRGRGRGRGLGRRTADSDEEEELPNKPTIQSSVVLTPKEPKSRQASLDEQKTDKKGTARNRRMFGLLLGTLQKFKDEAKESKDKEDQRKQIENKLEEKALEEKEEIVKERRQLFQERRQTQVKLRKIEQKIEIVETSQECQAERLKLANFIRTKAKPHIFYLPKMMNENLENKKKETATAINEMITQKQKQLEEEIEDLMAGGHDHDHPEEEEGQTGEGAGEGEGDKIKGEQPDKENRVSRHYRSKADEIAEQEGTTSRKRRKSSGERGERHKSGEDRDRKHRKSDEHQKDVHKNESDKTSDNKRRKSEHSGDRTEGRHRRLSHGEGDRKAHREGDRERSRGEGERRKSHGERDKRDGERDKRDGEKDRRESQHGDSDRRRSHGDEGHREDRRSHGEGGHEHDREGKKKDHRTREPAKRTEKKEDGVKVSIDYDEQEGEGEANDESNKTLEVPEKLPEIMDFSNMADIPMPDDVQVPKTT
ncbi:PNN [Mytilus coruscus]|uniref:Pinin n=1 Tax=Mytilus coruscus TaxID=42192 RepID=A0A6J8DJU0_MYTCO|nr:PNN [Mytilus coruscus]